MVFGVFCFSVKDDQFVEKNKKRYEVASYNASNNASNVPGAQVCVEHN